MIRAVVVLLAVAGRAEAAVCTANGASVTVTAPRIEVVVREGAIATVTNRVTGERHAEAVGLGDVGMPRGLGHVTGNPFETGRLHSQWGTYPSYAEAPVFHHPTPGSIPTVEHRPTGCVLTWTGLTNGTTSFAEQLSVEFAVAATGELRFRTAAQSPQRGVYGALVPLLNLGRRHRVYVPSFGGVAYDDQMEPGVRTLDRAPYLEAPAVALETARGSLGLWIADDTFRPSMLFLSWTGATFGVGLEQHNLLSPQPEPFPQQSFAGPWLSLDAFSDGWVGALAPYRAWHARTFTAERALRAAAPGAPAAVRVIVDQHARPDEVDVASAVFDELARFGPSRVLIFEGHARAAGFDQNHPDYTFKPEIPSWNQTWHARGFHTMGYVNSHVVNFDSPAFNQYDVWHNGLPRRYWSIFDLYSPPMPMHDFKNATPLELLYLDPLWPTWRALHVALMQGWRAAGFDFNYEDTAAPSGDWGNGTIDGLSSGQGSTALFRTLLSQPGVALATESCSDAIGFAARWPLRIYQLAGDETFRAWLMTHARPVETYLFGPDQAAWVPTAYAEDNFHRHFVVATSDALGGVAQFHALRATFRATRGDLGHAKMRARLFAAEGLEPTFEAPVAAPTLAAIYRSAGGGRYEYHVDGNEQRMVSPDGRVAYARITGVAEKTTSLLLEGWPAAWNGRVFGLDPAARYNVVDRARSLGPADTDVLITDLTPGVKVARYYETASHVVLVLDASPSGPVSPSPAVSLFTHSTLLRAWLNDASAALPPVITTGKTAGRYALALPARFVFVKQAPAAPAPGAFWGVPSTGPFIERETGIDRGGALPAWHPQSAMFVKGEGVIPAFVHEYGENSPQTLDYLVTVPSPTARVNLYLCTLPSDTSTAIVALNGRVMAQVGEHRTCGEGVIPLEIPAGTHYPHEVLVSLILDNGQYQANDFRLFSQPRFLP